jgi:hypothetical protein
VAGGVALSVVIAQGLDRQGRAVSSRKAPGGRYRPEKSMRITEMTWLQAEAAKPLGVVPSGGHEHLLAFWARVTNLTSVRISASWFCASP